VTAVTLRPRRSQADQDDCDQNERDRRLGDEYRVVAEVPDAAHDPGQVGDDERRRGARRGRSAVLDGDVAEEGSVRGAVRQTKAGCAWVECKAIVLPRMRERGKWARAE
jgi:hypothetical protein